jgi:hypothetical protein
MRRSQKRTSLGAARDQYARVGSTNLPRVISRATAPDGSMSHSFSSSDECIQGHQLQKKNCFSERHPRCTHMIPVAMANQNLFRLRPLAERQSTTRCHAGASRHKLLHHSLDSTWAATKLLQHAGIHHSLHLLFHSAHRRHAVQIHAVAGAAMCCL